MQSREHEGDIERVSELLLDAKRQEMELLADMVAQRAVARLGAAATSGGGGWLTVEQVAEKLQVSTASVYAMVKSGEIPCARVGRAIRVNEGQLDSVLMAR